MKVDCIIVGYGIAGLAFARQLELANKSFVVFDDASQKSSRVAAGVYNPIILKRYTAVWNGHEQIQYALPFYKALEADLSASFIHPFTTKKILHTAEDQNTWSSASTNPINDLYMGDIVSNETSSVIAPKGFGTLNGTGWIDIPLLLDTYKSYSTATFLSETFDHSQLIIQDTALMYKDIEATTIVFAEGYGMVHNPFFNYLPLRESKGDVCIIHSPQLALDFHLKGPVFVLPLGNHLYKVGATFNAEDKTNAPNPEDQKILLHKLDTMISVPYTVVEEQGAVRPTVQDRRPLVGIHPKHTNIAILNGLGTRGTMLAPTYSNQLLNRIFGLGEISKESNIVRFIKRFNRK